MALDRRLRQSLPSKPVIGRFVALTGLAAALATLTLLIGGMVKHELSTSLPSAGAQPSPAPEVPSTTAAERETQSARVYRSDGRGFLNSSARCTGSQVAVALGRTDDSLVVICEYGGEYEYRGVRQSDGAALTAAAEPASGGGFVATNDGVTYVVSADDLVVKSGGTVIKREPMIDYHQPRSLPESYSAPGAGSGSYPAESTPSTQTSAANTPSPETPRVVE